MSTATPFLAQLAARAAAARSATSPPPATALLDTHNNSSTAPSSSSAPHQHPPPNKTSTAAGKLWTEGSPMHPAPAIPPTLVATTDKAIEVWEEHAKRATAWLRAHPSSTQKIPAFKDPGALGVAVIVEPRRHPLLEFVLRNTAFFLGQHGWAMLVVHGTDNEAYVKAITEGWSGVAFKNLGKKNQTAADYNQMCTTPEFWEGLRPHATMAIFQTDMLWMSTLDPDFLAFDLIGAPWRNTCFLPGCGAPIMAGVPCCGRKVDDTALHQLAPELVGNGGAAVRGVEACLRVCQQFCMAANDKAGSGGRETVPNTSSEDVFFALCLPKVGGRVAPRSLALRFGIEQTLPVTLPADSAWAASSHKAYGYQPASVIAAMLAAYSMYDAASGDRFQDVPLREAYLKTSPILP